MAKDEVLKLDRGVKFEYTVQVTGIADLDGWTAKMQIREQRRPDAPLFAEWSTDSGELAVLGPELQVQIDVSAADTAEFGWDSGEYDLVLFNSGLVPYRILQGTVFVNNNVLVI